MDSREEKDVVDKARNDPGAFGLLFDEYYPKMFGYALKRIGIVQVAEDITSEVFYKAQKNLWQFAWRNIPFSAWLYRIATNEINHYFRRGIRHRSASLDALMEETDFEIAGNDDIARELEADERELESHKMFLAVQKDIAKLNIRYQEVVTLRFFENKKIDEIAAILGKKEGTVKSLLSRGMDRLRREWTTTQPSPSSGIIESERSR